MNQTRNRLLGYGITVCLAGIAFQMASTALLGFIVSSLPTQQPMGYIILEFITTVVASCVVPLGTAMIAISVALRMLGGRVRILTSAETADASDGT